MIESHLTAGRQDLAPGKELPYARAITDACIAGKTALRFWMS